MWSASRFWYHPCAKQHSAATKMWNASRFCMSSLRRGHAKLCNVPILVYVLPKASTLEKENSENWTKEEARWEGSEPKMCFIKIWTSQGYSRKTAQCSYKNVEHFTILHVNLAQGPCYSSLYCSNFSICTAEASTLEKENSEIWTREKAWTKMCFIKNLEPC